jgi:hypothetical protein
LWLSADNNPDSKLDSTYWNLAEWRLKSYGLVSWKGWPGMRRWLKALPLGLILPVAIGAASVKPEDATSNLVAWFHFIGVENVPAWLVTPGITHSVFIGSLGLAVLYAFAAWGIPWFRRTEKPCPDLPLRELFGYLAPHLPLTAHRKLDGGRIIGEVDQRWKPVGATVLKQLSLGRLHATGRELRGTKRLQAAPIRSEFWRDAEFTYWFLDEGPSVVQDAFNHARESYAEVEVNRSEAMAIWRCSPFSVVKSPT